MSLTTTNTYYPSEVTRYHLLNFRYPISKSLLNQKNNSQHSSRLLVCVIECNTFFVVDSYTINYKVTLQSIVNPSHFNSKKAFYYTSDAYKCIWLFYKRVKR